MHVCVCVYDVDVGTNEQTNDEWLWVYAMWLWRTYKWSGGWRCQLYDCMCGCVCLTVSLVVYAKRYTQTYWSHYAMASTRNPSGMCGMADNWAAATESDPVHRLMRRHFVFSAHYRCRQQSWFDGVRIIMRRISPIATVFGGLKWNFRSRNLLTLMMFLFPPQRYEAWRKATDSCGRLLDL